MLKKTSRIMSNLKLQIADPSDMNQTISVLSKTRGYESQKSTNGVNITLGKTPVGISPLNKTVARFKMFRGSLQEQSSNVSSPLNGGEERKHSSFFQRGIVVQRDMHVKAPSVNPEGGLYELKDRKSSHQTTAKES